jgi:hypothetical protein
MLLHIAHYTQLDANTKFEVTITVDITEAKTPPSI